MFVEKKQGGTQEGGGLLESFSMKLICSQKDCFVKPEKAEVCQGAQSFGLGVCHRTVTGGQLVCCRSQQFRSKKSWPTKRKDLSNHCF